MVEPLENRYCTHKAFGQDFPGQEMDKRLLDILCCPVSGVPLRLLGAAELESINRAIAEGRVDDRAGRRVDIPLAAGLVTRDGRSVYRIEDDIPVMLADEAIPGTRIGGLAGG
jgi:uncharacterized protein YbaR (Trm112 family)